MIQISEEKKEKLTEMCEKMLHYGGKLMQCLDGLEEEEEEGAGMGMRGGMRGGSGGMRGSMRAGVFRDEQYPEETDGMVHYRAGRRGRYDM